MDQIQSRSFQTVTNQTDSIVNFLTFELDTYFICALKFKNFLDKEYNV